MFHHGPGAGAGIIAPPTDATTPPVLTWHPTFGELTPTHVSDLTCWCRPRVMALTDDV